MGHGGLAGGQVELRLDCVRGRWGWGAGLEWLIGDRGTGCKCGARGPLLRRGSAWGQKLSSPQWRQGRSSWGISLRDRGTGEWGTGAQQGGGGRILGLVTRVEGIDFLGEFFA